MHPSDKVGNLVDGVLGAGIVPTGELLGVPPGVLRADVVVGADDPPV